MTKKIFFFSLLLFYSANISTLLAKSKITEKGIVQVTTYDQSGKSMGTACGFFVSNKGEVLADYTIFRGAYKAEVIDNEGKTWQVTRILGASDLYDIVKVRTDCEKSETYDLADKPATKGVAITLFSGDFKKMTLLQSQITESKTYDNLTYYTLANKTDNKLAGTPVFDQQGKVIGILQKTTDSEGAKSFAADIAVQKLLITSALSAGVTALNQIHIPKQLPADENQAASYIYLLSQNSQDTLSYLTALSDFKEAYPESVTYYVEHASYLAARKKFTEADADYNEAFQKVKKQADVHYNLSKLIYELCKYKDYEQYSDWDLNRALAEAQKAYETDAQPLYLLQVGDCQYAMKQYLEAFETYNAINKTDFASERTFYYAAKAREMYDDDSTIVLALLDSTIARFSEPYPKEAGPYLLQRAQMRQKYQYFRDAAIDYDAYEKLVGSRNLNDNFFYLKEQVEMQAHLYAWALNDIEKALQLKPNEYTYLVEKALIQLRIGENDEAIYSASQALKVKSDGADAYKMLGIAYGQKEQKAEAIKNLKKAKELGDPQVDEWIQELEK